MIVLSTDVPVVHLLRSWSDAAWLARLCGATDGQRTSDSRRHGRDNGGQAMNLCERCLAMRNADRSTVGASRGAL